MTGTESVPVPVPAGGYMAIVQEFEVSPPSNPMLTECETLSVSPTQQPQEPPQQQQPQSQQQTLPQQPPPAPAPVVRNEVSTNLNTSRENTNLLQNENNQLQQVLPSTNYITCNQTPTKQSK